MFVPGPGLVWSQAGDVLVQTGETATFGWQLPDLGDALILFVFKENNNAVYFSVVRSTNAVGANQFGSRLNYLGDITQRNMAFTLSNVVASDAGWYRCGKDSVSNEIDNCGQRLVVIGKFRISNSSLLCKRCVCARNYKHFDCAFVSKLCKV